MRGVGLRPCVHGGGVCMECGDLQEVLITIIAGCRYCKMAPIREFVNEVCCCEWKKL